MASEKLAIVRETICNCKQHNKTKGIAGVGVVPENQKMGVSGGLKWKVDTVRSKLRRQENIPGVGGPKEKSIIP